MRIDHESSLTPRWIVFGTALVYFALGSVLTAHFIHLKDTWAADSHRVFQIKIHHAVPVKMPLLEKRLCRASRLDRRVIGDARRRDEDYSLLSACIGSIDAARRAGMNPATVAQIPSTIVVPR
jgi:hypothetical protein